MVCLDVSKLKKVLIPKYMWTYKNNEVEHMQTTTWSSSCHANDPTIIHLLYGCLGDHPLAPFW